MSKVLFDCVVTQSPPSKCSTTIMFVTLAHRLLAQPDTYIYWPVPDWVTDEEMQWFPQSERIQYIPVPQSKDRMKEYTRLSFEMESIIAFNGTHWDWDVLVTMRSLMVPIMRTISIRPGQDSRSWTKRIYLIENMMIMSCKPTVAQSTVDVQDRLCFEAYLAADKTMLPAYHQKALALRIAKNHFSASRLKDLNDKIREVCQLDMPETNLKDAQYRYDGKRKLNVYFVGRMERANARLALMNEVFTNQFILNSDKLESAVCTVSPTEKEFDSRITMIKHPPREEFWRICKEEMDVSFFAHVDIELNLSMLEPLSFGVPSIVKMGPWSIGLLGPDYPFFFESKVEAYAIMTNFTKKYDYMYAKFTEWYEGWFLPTYKYRVEVDGLYKVLMENILSTALADEYGHTLKSLENNEIVNLMKDKGGKEFVIFELVQELGKTDLRGLADKAHDGDREKRSITFSTQWNDFRLGLQKFHGFKDASIKVGHMIKTAKKGSK